MSTIVLIVLAILVLLALVILFTRAFQTGAVDTQTAINNCNSKCLLEIQYAQGQSGTFTRTNSPFCSTVQDVKGVEDNVRCDELTSCTITRGDGTSCIIACNSTTPTSYDC